MGVLVAGFGIRRFGILGLGSRVFHVTMKKGT